MSTLLSASPSVVSSDSGDHYAYSKQAWGGKFLFDICTAKPPTLEAYARRGAERTPTKHTHPPLTPNRSLRGRRLSADDFNVEFKRLTNTETSNLRAKHINNPPFLSPRQKIWEMLVTSCCVSLRRLTDPWQFLPGCWQKILVLKDQRLNFIYVMFFFPVSSSAKHTFIFEEFWLNYNVPDCVTSCSITGFPFQSWTSWRAQSLLQIVFHVFAKWIMNINR